MSAEKLRTKDIPRLYFKPEGYKSAHDEDYLDELLDMLRENGYEPDNLIFSGFDGSFITKGQPLDRHPTIFGMNVAAWRKYSRGFESTPAEYATSNDYEVPCIALYDKAQLAEAYAYDFDDSQDPDERLELTDIVLGNYLADLEPWQPIEEVIIHKDPGKTPSDALVGYVFIKE